MAQTTTDQSVVGMTTRELERLVCRIVRRERRGECFVDDDGTLVFYREADYSRYLKLQSGKSPSQVQACFVDEAGFRFRHSDWALTPAKKKELQAVPPRGRKRVGADTVWAGLRELGVEI